MRTRPWAVSLLLILAAAALHEPQRRPHEAPVRLHEPPQPQAPVATQEAAALAIACEVYGDGACDPSWTVFATLPPAIIVTRSTGDCGGCGLLAVAVMFRAGGFSSHAVLGTFGRFANGPDAARWIEIGGGRALAVDWSESKGGYSYSYRRLYWIEDDSIRPGLCIQTAFSNRGALEDSEAWEWDAIPHVRRSGALELQYRVTYRGEAAPRVRRVRRIPADRVRAVADFETDCVGPT